MTEPLTFNEKWKAYRLHCAGWETALIARMYGKQEAEITAAIDACAAQVGAPPEAA